MKILYILSITYKDISLVIGIGKGKGKEYSKKYPNVYVNVYLYFRPKTQATEAVLKLVEDRGKFIDCFRLFLILSKFF